jgi:hypothetical protein
MSTLESVGAFITRLSPAPVCDGCITERLALPNRQSTGQHTKELAGSNGYERRRDICSLCFGEKIVIRRV